MTRSLIFASILFLTPLSVAAAAENRAPRPNIVVILSDDMGFSDIGCYGSEIRTPALDRLAAGGLRFTQFYNTARCCPTRASLLTGLYPHQAGVGHMMSNQQLPGYRGDLARNCPTIAEVLKSAGYATYMAGKWHVTRFDRPDAPNHNWPRQRGFDRYYGLIRGGGSFFDPASLTRDNTMISPFVDPEYKPDRYYLTDAISDHAVRFVEEHRQSRTDQPFFLYVAYTTAHWPMHALEEDIARYKGRYDEGYEPVRRRRLERAKELGLVPRDCELSPTAGKWDAVENKAWEARCMEVYAAMVDRMDQGIARLVATLEKNGELDNTLILYLQDNGGCAEDVGRPGQDRRQDKPTLPPIAADAVRIEVHLPQTREGFPVIRGTGVMPGPADTFIAYGRGWANVSNTPFREYKHWVHEGGISTPLVAHWPKGIHRKGELEHQPGHLIDIMATCIELAGAEVPAEREGHPVPRPEGVSLTPAFAGKPLPPRTLYWEHEGNRAVREGPWKLVAKGPDGPWELYNIETDRIEVRNLAAEQPEKVAALRRKWEAWATRAKVIPWPWKPQYTPGSEGG